MKKFVIIGVIVLLLIIGAVTECVDKGKDENAPSDTQTKTEEESTSNKEDTTEAKTVLPTYKMKTDKEEEGTLYLDYIFEGDTDFFTLTDKEKSTLAENILDDGFKKLESEYPDIKDLWIMVWSQNGTDLTLSITTPNIPITTPKVDYYKYDEKLGGAVFDVMYYDNRYGNGQTWGD